MAGAEGQQLKRRIMPARTPTCIVADIEDIVFTSSARCIRGIPDLNTNSLDG